MTEPTADRPSNGNRNKYIVFAVAAAIVLTIIVIESNAGDKTKSSSGVHSIVYKVEGSAPSVDITMSNPGGGQSQQADLAVPITRKQDGTEGLHATFRGGEFLYISAQNQGDSGSVTCIIEEDGVEIARNTSSGGYVIASCQGTA